MRRAWAWALAGACLGAGCSRGEPAPEDEALERYDRANGLFERGLYREAVPDYEFVLSVRDRIRDAYVRLSRCHEELGDEGQAMAVLERARRVARYDEPVLRGLARLYARKGRSEEAIRAWEDLLEIRPGDEAARAELARLKAPE